MPNTLTGISRDAWKAADMIGRELTGAIPSVTLNAGLQTVPKGETVKSIFTRQPTLNTSLTPSMTIPEGDVQTLDVKSVTLDLVANVMIPWEGEEIRKIDNTQGFGTVYGDQLAQAFRKIVNQIEIGLCAEIYKNASRAVGTAGTTPFASNLDVIAEGRKILVDNGTPDDGLWTLLFDTTAGVKFRNLTQNQKVNEAGTDQLIRRGTLLQTQGFNCKESAGIRAHTKGTGASYLLNGAVAAEGKALTLDTGSGTILQGDIVTLAGDANKYCVNSALASNIVTIGEPGLLAAGADNTALTVGNSFTPNAFWHRNAVELAVRPWADPPGGDAAVDTMIVQDPLTGIPFEVKLYKGFKKMMLSITVLYGYKVWKPNFVGVLLG